MTMIYLCIVLVYRNYNTECSECDSLELVCTQLKHSRLFILLIYLLLRLWTIRVVGWINSYYILYKIVINALSNVKQEIIAFFRQGTLKWDVWTGIYFLTINRHL